MNQQQQSCAFSSALHSIYGSITTWNGESPHHILLYVCSCVHTHMYINLKFTWDWWGPVQRMR